MGFCYIQTMTSELPRSILKNKNTFLFAIAAIFALNSLVSWIAVPYPTADAVTAILLGVALVTAGIIWIHLDADERGIPLGHGFRLFAILIFGLALPYYLFKSRGAKRALWSILKLIGFLAVILILVFALELALALIQDRKGIFI